MAERYSQEEVASFYLAADSLRKYRRAELVDDKSGDSLLEELYCDPLPAQGLSTRLSSPTTTLIVGRKGTGKSTVFQKLQHDVRKTRDRITAYVDIKTVWDSAQVDVALQEKVSKIEHALPPPAIERLLIYRAFLRNVVIEIKAELQKKLSESLWEKIKNSFSSRHENLYKELDSFIENYSDENFIRVIGVKSIKNKDQGSSSATTQGQLATSASLSPEKFGATVSADFKTGSEVKNSGESEYSDLLLNVFNPADLIFKLKEVLKKSGFRYLYVLIDDFSELPVEPMRAVVDVLLAPLNNLSDEFIKLKIAAYPGRIYLGAIDRTKIDEVYLDLFKLYGSGDITRLEESGIDFTRRLVLQRLSHYCGGDPFRFFERGVDEVFRQLFNACLCNPRILGHLLVYLYDSHVAAGKLIGLRAIGEASRKFYEEKVESYFQTGRFLQEAFEERSSIYSLKELLESFVQRARELRRHTSNIFSEIEGVPPTSHFYIAPEHESLLATLELNFFVTKYFEMSNREGKIVAVFALNLGLCEKYSISFGRPRGQRVFRLYFVERVFDYSPQILNYLRNNQEIVCGNCGTRYELVDLDKLKFYNMRCPNCSTGTCRVINLSKKYEVELQSVRAELLLPKTELGILQTLESSGESMRAGDIAEELDCSHQLIGRRAKNLEERKLVDRSLGDDGRRNYALTELAKHSYFDPSEVVALRLNEDVSGAAVDKA
jgi:DNA-binding MarR family transcriptional regulator